MCVLVACVLVLFVLCYACSDLRCARIDLTRRVCLRLACLPYGVLSLRFVILCLCPVGGYADHHEGRVANCAS